MNVLVACEESQAVCKAFREKGHRAFSCDIQSCSGGFPEYHIKCDVLTILNGNVMFITEDNKSHYIDGNWDLIIAHPPCTYLSNAGARWLYTKSGVINSERYKKLLEGREFFLKFYNCKCEKVAIENPLPMKIAKLPKPSQIIQPYMFGEPYSKKTLLWLKNLPPLMSTDIRANDIPYLPSNTSNLAKGKGGSRGVVRGAKNYSKTFPGVAAAMANQWG